MGYPAEMGNKRENEESAPHSKLQKARWLEKGGLAQGALWEELRLFGTNLVSLQFKHPLFTPKPRASSSERGRLWPWDEPPLLRRGWWGARPQRGAGIGLWLAPPRSALLPLQVTAADAGSICHELIPLSLRRSGERNGSAFPAY